MLHDHRCPVRSPCRMTASFVVPLKGAYPGATANCAVDHSLYSAFALATHLRKRVLHFRVGKKGLDEVTNG